MTAYIQDLGQRTANVLATYNVSLSASATAGSVVLLEAMLNGTATISSVADSKGNTWTRVGTQVATSSPVVRIYQYYTLQDVGALTSTDTVTCTCTVGTGNSCVAILREIGATGFDVSAGQANNSSSTAANTGTTATTTQASEIVWETIGTSATNTSWTKDTNFSLPTTNILQPATTGRTLLSAYRDITSTGTQSASNTLGTAALSATIISTFKVTSVTPPTNTSPPTISGVAQVGNDLIGTPGSWTG